MRRYALIVAGGQGTRMKSSLPKQFLLVNNKPVLMHTMERFVAENITIILVLNADYHEYWKQLCGKYRFTIAHELIAGGDTRAESVFNGLQNLDLNSYVVVHDAVRPLVSSVLINKLFDESAQYGNAVPVVTIRESLRELNGGSSFPVDREKYRIVQTPQCFRVNDLLEAFKNPQYKYFTDEASLYEATGKKVHLIEGEFANIKITYPEDLLFASAVLSQSV